MLIIIIHKSPGGCYASKAASSSGLCHGPAAPGMKTHKCHYCLFDS